MCADTKLLKKRSWTKIPEGKRKMPEAITFKGSFSRLASS
jgi:hypothetical protein